MLVSLRKFLSQKGAAIIEYAVLLAFVCVLGYALIGTGGLGSGVSAVVTKTQTLLTSAANLTTTEAGGMQAKPEG